MTIAGGLLLLTAVFGCAGSQDGPRRADTTAVTSSDPELRALGAEILPRLVERSGLELRAPVRVERRSAAELERFLLAQLDRELPEDEAERVTAAYALLGLVPSDLQLRELLLGVYLEQVAGFYDPDSAALFVTDTQGPELLRPILVHELVHALQDQHAPLDSITADDLPSDQRTAAQAAIEGHATVVMLEFVLEDAQGSPVDLSTLPPLAMGPLLAAAVTAYPALAGAPRVIQEGLLYPYVEGATFVLDLWRMTSGRPVPFGEHLPLSTEQVEDPSRLAGPTPDPPSRVTITADVSPEHTDDLGALGTRILLSEIGAPDTTAWAGWDGDRLALFPDSGSGRSLVWATVWDSEAERDRFLVAVAGSEAARQGRMRVTAETVEARPAAVVRVGVPPDVSMRLEGSGSGGPGPSR